MLLTYFIGWPLMQLAVAYLINFLDNKYFQPDNFILKSRKWESAFYRRVIKVPKWKHLLPDGAATYKSGFKKKRLGSSDSNYLNQFIIETGRAEIMHWLEILPFWVFALWSPGYVVWIMLGYALVVNVPCIITQRFNRPRLVKVSKSRV
ncbi:MAG: glycosyl-4 4'-diaponeurosporenoate acyltransferase [Fusobacteria bacterium]|nr:MAG: glycosyl-4 4'-diaponeurosporenoate acyltransferase [Fusobacteriota bacterium]KAF0229202.1 MAG: glycosyl-4 4'-diaponeurosporenoate [Fusobacteriota bacterium]